MTFVIELGGSGFPYRLSGDFVCQKVHRPFCITMQARRTRQAMQSTFGQISKIMACRRRWACCAATSIRRPSGAPLMPVWQKRCGGLPMRVQPSLGTLQLVALMQVCVGEGSCYPSAAIWKVHPSDGWVCAGKWQCGASFRCFAAHLPPPPQLTLQQVTPI